MMNIIIENYIRKLSYTDFKYYLNKYDINIDEKSKQYFFKLLKENIKDVLIYPEKYLEIIKNRIDTDNYQKIYNLYTTYSKKLYY